MSNKSRLQTNNTNLQGLIDKANALPDAGSGSSEDLDSVITELETKVASLNTTLDDKASGGGEQATPVISVNSTNGLITATAGNKSSTKQLTTQAAQTITPGTSDKTIASGSYLTGTQTIKGDANLKAENIAEGVSIFDVTGTHSGGSGGGSGSIETCTVDVSVSKSGMISASSYIYHSTLESNDMLGLHGRNSVTKTVTCPKDSTFFIDLDNFINAVFVNITDGVQ